MNDVEAIESSAGRRRIRTALLGGGIGLLAGGIAGGLSASGSDNGDFGSSLVEAGATAEAAIGGALVGAVLGGLVGDLIAPEAWRKVRMPAQAQFFGHRRRVSFRLALP